MPKLPICPYCGYKFDYSRSSKALHEKNLKCKKCGKIMSVSYKFAAFKMGVMFFVFLVALNTIYLFNASVKTILPNVFFTVFFIVLYLVLVPLKVSFLKIDGQEESHEKLKKNRHRHKKTKNKDTLVEENPIKGTSFDQ